MHGLNKSPVKNNIQTVWDYYFNVEVEAWLHSIQNLVDYLLGVEAINTAEGYSKRPNQLCAKGRTYY